MQVGPYILTATCLLLVPAKAAQHQPTERMSDWHTALRRGRRVSYIQQGISTVTIPPVTSQDVDTSINKMQHPQRADIVARYLNHSSPSEYDKLLKKAVKKHLQGMYGGSEDPEVELARQISWEQVQLWDRLSAVRRDLKDANITLQKELDLGNRSSNSMEDMRQRVLEANVTAQMNNRSSITIAENQLRVNASAGFLRKRVNGTRSVENSTRVNIVFAQNTQSSGTRVDTNLRILNVLRARLERMRSTVEYLDTKLNGGKVDDVVDEAVRDGMSNIMEDVDRVLITQLPAS